MAKRRRARGAGSILEIFVDPLFGAFGAFLFIFLMVTLIVGVTGVAPEIVTERLPDAIHGEPYEVWLSGRGGVGIYSWRPSPEVTLPPGLELSEDGRLSGRPFLAADRPVDEDVELSLLLEALQLKTENPEEARAIRKFSLKVVRDRPIRYSEIPPIEVVTESPLPEAMAGRPYAVALSAAGGLAPYRWRVEGSLPAGLHFDAATGILSGKTALPVEALNLRFQVMDSRPSHFAGTSSEKSLELAILEPPPSAEEGIPAELELAILSTELPTAEAKAAYRSPVALRGGKPPLSFRAQGLPKGLTLNDRGFVEGIPAKPGQIEFQVTVFDSWESPQEVTGKIRLPVAKPPSPVTILTETDLPKARIGRAYDLALAAGDFRWKLEGELPKGLVFADGRLHGTPEQATPGRELTVTAWRPSHPSEAAEKKLRLEVQSTRPLPPIGSKKWLWLLAVAGVIEFSKWLWRKICFAQIAFK